MIKSVARLFNSIFLWFKSYKIDNNEYDKYAQRFLNDYISAASFAKVFKNIIDNCSTVEEKLEKMRSIDSVFKTQLYDNGKLEQIANKDLPDESKHPIADLNVLERLNNKFNEFKEKILLEYGYRSSDHANWKDVILGIPKINVTTISAGKGKKSDGDKLTPNYLSEDLTSAESQKRRFESKHITGDNKEYSSIYGTTYVGGLETDAKQPNIPYAQQNVEDSQLVQNFKLNDTLQVSLLGVADGLSFHDSKINSILSQRLAWFSLKHSQRLVMAVLQESKNKTSEELVEILQTKIKETVLPDLLKELQLKFNNDKLKSSVNTALALGIVIEDKEHNTQKLVYLNIGDTMIASYNNQEESITTISSATQEYNGLERSYNPVGIPNHFKDTNDGITRYYEVGSQSLTKHDTLMIMSDGIYDYLPLIEEEKNIARTSNATEIRDAAEEKIRQISLDGSKILEELKSSDISTTEKFTKAFHGLAVQKTENIREELYNNQTDKKVALKQDLENASREVDEKYNAYKKIGIEHKEILEKQDFIEYQKEVVRIQSIIGNKTVGDDATLVTYSCKDSKSLAPTKPRNMEKE